MTESPDSDGRAPKLNRRRLLQGLAATGVAATAGCLGGDSGDGEPGADLETAFERSTVDPSEIQEGGTLTFTLARSGVANFDQAQSTQADDSTVFEAVYDSLRQASPEGEYFTWMAETFDVAESQEVSFPEDYTDYMESYEIASVEEGVPTFDLGANNLALGQHPEDQQALADGELVEGDSMRLLTRNESGAAVDDGTFGSRIDVTLHEGIEFHNGEECTAGNVVGSYDRFVGSNNEGQQFESLLHARSTNGPDGYELEMYAIEPDATADLSLPPFFIFPSDHLDVPAGDLDPRGDGPTPVGTGPYEVDSFEEGQEVVLTKTDNYWLEEVGLDSKDWWDGPSAFPEGPVIDEIVIRFQSEDGQRVAALQDGSTDMSYDLPAADITTFQQSSDFEEYTVTAAESVGFRFMQIPLQDNGGALHNAEVRQALQQMIPRQDIVDVVEDGWALPARTPFPSPAAELGTAGEFEDLFDEDWAYPVEAQPDEAESLINDAGVETPIDLVLETNADDSARQDKIELIVGEMDAAGLFDAELQTPADLNPWFVQNLLASDSGNTYAERNATATMGIAADFEPDSYVRGLHHPDNYKGCCNFFHPSGTFEFEDAIDDARFGVDVVDSPSTRQEMYDDLWPSVVEAAGNTFIDFSIDIVVAGPRVEGYNAYPDRREFLNYSLYAPFEELVAYIDE